MANIKISELDELQEVADQDLFVIVDSDENTTKKIQAGNLNIKGGDTLPIGAMVEYNGTTVPQGYEKVSDNNIIESGSNENGEYIKFADGTMICKNTQRISGVTTSVSSSNVVPKSAEQTGFNFPMEFIDRPIVLMNACRHSAWIGYSWMATTSTTQNYCVYTNAPVSDFYIDIQYVAFGRWK